MRDVNYDIDLFRGPSTARGGGGGPLPMAHRISKLQVLGLVILAYDESNSSPIANERAIY